MMEPLLATVVLKASAVVVATGALLFLARRWSAADRHRLCTLAIVGMLVVPLWSVAAPGLRVELAAPSWLSRLIDEAEPGPLRGAAEETRATRVRGGLAGDRSPDSRAATAAPARDPGAPPAPARARRGDDGGVSWLWLLWGFGAATLLLRLSLGFVHLGLLRRRSVPATDTGWADALEAGMARLGLVRPIRLLQNPRPGVPLTWGLFRPVVIVPAATIRWTPECLRQVLLHELAHVRRRDWAAQLLGQLAGVVYWFNPLVWWLVRRQRTEAERACDELVLRAGERPEDYAACLLRLARECRSSPTALQHALPLLRRPELEERLRALIHPERVFRTGRQLGGALLALLVILGSVAAVRLRGAERPVAALVRQLQSPDPAVRQRAAWGLGEAEDRAAVESLLAAVRADPDSRVRTVAVWALGEIKDSRATAPLAALLNEPDPRLREMLARALGEIEDPRAIAPLTGVLDDPDPGVAAAGAWALGEIEGAAAARALARALEHSEQHVRSTAASALAHHDPDIAAPALIKGLDDAATAVRVSAAYALGRTGSDSAIRPLLGALAGPEPAVREAAAWALGKLDDPAAVPGLLDALYDDEYRVRDMAVWALDEIRSR